MLDCESPVTGLEMNRNWSDVPWMAAPDAVTVSTPLVVCSEPAIAGLRMSWQVKVAGQFGSAGGAGGQAGSPETDHLALAPAAANLPRPAGDAPQRAGR